MISRMRATPKLALLLAVFCTLAGLATEAQAYLDPSTGSMIMSAIVGLFATIGLAVKTYWYKLKNLFKARKPPVVPEPQAAPRQPVDPVQGNETS
jgi:peptidoglycan/LPS O-acetylase OafA/YrhL